jgi:predicted NAD/FAD-binding protein
MTFSVSRDRGLFEWAGTSLSAIFAQRKNLLKPRMWRMIFDIIRFNQFALNLLHDEDESALNPSGQNGCSKTTEGPLHEKSIGAYLDQHGYSDAFRDDYLIPMTAAVWSTSPDKALLEFPAVTLIRFLWNHHLLSTISARPSWMTIMNGAKQYIDAVMADFPPERVYIGTAVVSLEIQSNDQIKLKRADGKEDTYDHVILATHGDEALQIIRPIATAEEIDIMSGFKTSTNTAVLHSDLSVSHAIVIFSLLLTPSS